MAYSKSPVTLYRRRPHVEPLFRGERTRWVAPFPEGADAAKWAYKVRECLWVALKQPRRFPDLAKYAKLYRVKVINDSTVEAYIEGTEDSGETLSQVTTTSPLEPVALPGTTRFDIVNAFREGAIGSGPWYFRAAHLSMADRKKLEAWATAFEPPLTIQEGETGLTISRRREK